MPKKQVVTITGIRPDFIRMASVFKELDEHFDHIMIHTGQHYSKMLSDVFFDDLDIRKPDYNLGIGGEGIDHTQQLGLLSMDIVELFRKEEKIHPDIILFLGDSNSVLASIPLRKEGYRIGHIEAGMRSGDMRMLEEINRKLCDQVSHDLFIYHENYRTKLLREGIEYSNIHTVGNTIVEVVQGITHTDTYHETEHILMDIHRPENFQYADRMLKIMNYATQYSLYFNLPIKMLEFPRAMKTMEEYGISIPDCIEIVPLMSFKDFLEAQCRSRFIFSDSGTAQEEPALFGVPVVVPRDFTERPESVEHGCSFMLELRNQSYKESLTWIENADPDSSWLGNGTAARQIRNYLLDTLK